MFWGMSSQKFKNMHFASCSANGGKGDLIGLAELRFGRFGPRRERRRITAAEGL
jgi:hypothetical protein